MSWLICNDANVGLTSESARLIHILHYLAALMQIKGITISCHCKLTCKLKNVNENVLMTIN